MLKPLTCLTVLTLSPNVWALTPLDDYINTRQSLRQRLSKELAPSEADNFPRDSMGLTEADHNRNCERAAYQQSKAAAKASYLKGVIERTPACEEEVNVFLQYRMAHLEKKAGEAWSLETGKTEKEWQEQAAARTASIKEKQARVAEVKEKDLDDKVSFLRELQAAAHDRATEKEDSFNVHHLARLHYHLDPAVTAWWTGGEPGNSAMLIQLANEFEGKVRDSKK